MHELFFELEFKDPNDPINLNSKYEKVEDEPFINDGSLSHMNFYLGKILINW